MSHEIRTPMNGIMGMNELLLDTELTEEQRSYAGSIQHSADSLLNILNDILDFSKIEAGKLKIDESPFDLHTAIANVVALLSARAAQKGLRIELLYPKQLPRWFTGDVGRIRQIVTNLLSNAAKFTELVEVTVRVCFEPVGLTAVEAIVAVSDTGIGIAAEHLELLFQQFSQLDNSSTRKHGGTGLGLAISKQLAGLMGGSIQVDSTLGKGSTFYVHLPLKLSELAAV